MVKEFHFRQTGCGLVKRREDARLYAAVESCSILQSNWESIFQPEKIPFDETKISNEEVIAPGTVIRQVEIVPILEK
jgi:hypothetical protein